MSDLSVIIADDHDLFRMGVRALVQQTEGLTLQAEAADGTELQAALKEYAPDLLILDHDMPGMSGLEVVTSIRRTSREVILLVITGMESAQLMLDFKQLGVNGLILKSDPTDTVKDALNAIVAGDDYYSSSVTSLLHAENPLAVLSSRERLVLRHIAKGLTNKHIAAAMGLSPKTIDNHRTRLMAKLDLHNTAEVVRFALDAGLD